MDCKTNLKERISFGTIKEEHKKKPKRFNGSLERWTEYFGERSVNIMFFHYNTNKWRNGNGKITAIFSG